MGKEKRPKPLQHLEKLNSLAKAFREGLGVKPPDARRIARGTIEAQRRLRNAPSEVNSVKLTVKLGDGTDFPVTAHRKNPFED